jgi:hypothetical protein
MDMQNIDVMLEPLRALLQQVGSFTAAPAAGRWLVLLVAGSWPRRSASAS